MRPATGVRLSLLLFEALDDTDTSWQENPSVHFPGALFHATCLPTRQVSRGNQGRLIFHDDDDRERYLTILQGLPTRVGCKLYAYV